MAKENQNWQLEEVFELMSPASREVLAEIQRRMQWISKNLDSGDQVFWLQMTAFYCEMRTNEIIKALYEPPNRATESAASKRRKRGRRGRIEFGA